MNLLFWQNLFGYEISDQELKYVPYPRTELNFHVLLKTVKTFTVIGSLAVGPVLTLAVGPRSVGQLVVRAVQCGRIGALLAVPTAPIATNGLLFYKNADRKDIEMRCYKLRRNKKEHVVDQYFLGGSLLLTPFLGWAGFIIATNNAVLFGNIVNRLEPKHD